MGLGKYNEAIECFDEALRLNPEYTFARNGKSIALEILNRNTKANANYAYAKK